MCFHRLSLVYRRGKMPSNPSNDWATVVTFSSSRDTTNTEQEEKKSALWCTNSPFSEGSLSLIHPVEQRPIGDIAAKECLPKVLEIPHHTEWEAPVAVVGQGEWGVPYASPCDPTVHEAPPEEQAAAPGKDPTAVSLARFSDVLSMTKTKSGEEKATETPMVLDGSVTSGLQARASADPRETGKLELTVSEGCTSCHSCINIKIQLVSDHPPLSLSETTHDHHDHHHHPCPPRAIADVLPSKSKSAQASPSRVDRTSVPTMADDAGGTTTVARSPPTVLLLPTRSKEKERVTVAEGTRGIGEEEEEPERRMTSNGTVQRSSSSSSSASPHPLITSSGSSVSFSFPLFHTPKGNRRHVHPFHSERDEHGQKTNDSDTESIGRRDTRQTEGLKPEEEEEVDTISCFTGFPTPVRISPLPFHRPPAHSVRSFMESSGSSVSADPRKGVFSTTDDDEKGKMVILFPSPRESDREVCGEAKKGEAVPRIVVEGGRMRRSVGGDAQDTTFSVAPHHHDPTVNVPSGTRRMWTVGGVGAACPALPEPTVSTLLNGATLAMAKDRRTIPASTYGMWYTHGVVPEVDVTASPLSDSTDSMGNAKKHRAFQSHPSAQIVPSFSPLSSSSSPSSSSSSSFSSSSSSSSSLFADAEALTTTMTGGAITPVRSSVSPTSSANEVDTWYTAPSLGRPHENWSTRATPMPCFSTHTDRRHHHHHHRRRRHEAHGGSGPAGSTVTGVVGQSNTMGTITRHSVLQVVRKAQHYMDAEKQQEALREGLLVYYIPRERPPPHSHPTPILADPNPSGKYSLASGMSPEASPACPLFHEKDEEKAVPARGGSSSRVSSHSTRRSLSPPSRWSPPIVPHADLLATREAKGWDLGGEEIASAVAHRTHGERKANERRITPREGSEREGRPYGGACGRAHVVFSTAVVEGEPLVVPSHLSRTHRAAPIREAPPPPPPSCSSWPHHAITPASSSSPSSSSSTSSSFSFSCRVPEAVVPDAQWKSAPITTDRRTAAKDHRRRGKGEALDHLFTLHPDIEIGIPSNGPVCIRLPGERKPIPPDHLSAFPCGVPSLARQEERTRHGSSPSSRIHGAGVPFCDASLSRGMRSGKITAWEVPSVPSLAAATTSLPERTPYGFTSSSSSSSSSVEREGERRGTGLLPVPTAGIPHRAGGRSPSSDILHPHRSRREAKAGSDGLAVASSIRYGAAALPLPTEDEGPPALFSVRQEVPSARPDDRRAHTRDPVPMTTTTTTASCVHGGEPPSPFIPSTAPRLLFSPDRKEAPPPFEAHRMANARTEAEWSVVGSPRVVPVSEWTTRHRRPLLSASCVAPPVFPLSGALHRSLTRETATVEDVWWAPPPKAKENQRHATKKEENHPMGESESGGEGQSAAVASAARVSRWTPSRPSQATEEMDKEGREKMPTTVGISFLPPSPPPCMEEGRKDKGTQQQSMSRPLLLSSAALPIAAASTISLPYRSVEYDDGASPSPSPVNPCSFSIPPPYSMSLRSLPLMSPSPDSDEGEEKAKEVRFSRHGSHRRRERKEKILANSTTLHTDAVTSFPLRLSQYCDGDPAALSSSFPFRPRKEKDVQKSRTPLQSFLE